MSPPVYWADKYVENKRTATEAIALIKPAQRVFIGSSCGEPQHLVRALSEASNTFKDIEINRLMTMETTPLTLIADKSRDQSLPGLGKTQGHCPQQAIYHTDQSFRGAAII